MNGAAVLSLQFSPSRGLAAALVVAHGAAGACAWALLPGIGGGALGLALLALGAATAWDRALLAASRSMRGLEINAERKGTMVLADGSRVPLLIGEKRWVSRYCVGMPLDLSGRGLLSRRQLLVSAGMLPPAAFRRLRLWAVWGRVPAPRVAPGQLAA